MRTLPEGLKAHVEGQATTLCTCWRLTRRDGLVLGFTDHDGDLTFDGTIFSAVTGFSASDVESEIGMSVDNGEVAGAFSAEAITEKDLREGRFDGARVEVFAVNWTAPAERVLTYVHEIGEVSFGGKAFRAELRGLAHRLDRVQGRFYGRRCDADLGDGRCGISLAAGENRAAGWVVAAEGRDAVLVAGLDGHAAGWFRYGLLTWIGGANDGLQVEILDHAVTPEGVRLSFWSPAANEPAPSDAFTVTAGCDKTFGTCRAKFNNQLNFRGFPHLPGSDFAYAYANGETVHDGRPLVP